MEGQGQTCIACGALWHDVPSVTRTPRWCAVCDPSSVQAVNVGGGAAEEVWLQIEPAVQPNAQAVAGAAAGDGGGGGAVALPVHGAAEERSTSAEYVLVNDPNSRFRTEAAGGMGGMPREEVNVGLAIDSMHVGARVKAIRDSAKGKYAKGHTGKCTGCWGDRIWVVWDHNGQESRTADWHDAVVVIKTGG